MAIIKSSLVWSTRWTRPMRGFNRCSRSRIVSSHYQLSDGKIRSRCSSSSPCLFARSFSRSASAEDGRRISSSIDRASGRGAEATTRNIVLRCPPIVYPFFASRSEETESFVRRTCAFLLVDFFLLLLLLLLLVLAPTPPFAISLVLSRRTGQGNERKSENERNGAPYRGNCPFLSSSVLRHLEKSIETESSADRGSQTAACPLLDGRMRPSLRT